MPDNALIVNSGKVLMGKLLRGEDVQGITHCALGAGDGTFTDPLNPPAPTPDQTLLKSEFIRKTPYKSSFLVEDPNGTITVDGVTYAETPQETLTIGVFFRYADYEAADRTIKEVGFFGGDVAYVEGVTGQSPRTGSTTRSRTPTARSSSPATSTRPATSLTSPRARTRCWNSSPS